MKEALFEHTPSPKSHHCFYLRSSSASMVMLCLFDAKGDEQQFIMEHNGDCFSLCLDKSIAPVGTHYGFRLFGQKHNHHKLALDPLAKQVSHSLVITHENAPYFCINNDLDNAHLAPKAVIIDENFAWENDRLPKHPWEQTIIYEAHVKGLTASNDKLEPHLRGTYLGLCSDAMIAYFKDLGITTIELLPISFAFDEIHLQKRGMSNYWGYNPLAITAPSPRYAIEPLNALNELKTMIKTLHAHGIEVILDIVFNHSCEMGRDGVSICQRLIDEQQYYFIDDKGNYINDTGTGNMIRLDSSIGQEYLIESLLYFARECHVDGFRFDLATNLGREQKNHYRFCADAKTFHMLIAHPVLSKLKLIAEPWDLGLDGYQLGNFPAPFYQWNDKFRDEVRKFWLWQSGDLATFAKCIAGSSDIFAQTTKSINFITAHDGFTLQDLCCFNHKHNWANGENNRDGSDSNFSYNHGVEGLDYENEHINHLRLISQSALLATLLLAKGVPMITAGDEFGNSQQGNNNAYCQDNEIAYLNWQSFDNKKYNRVKKLIAIRQSIPSLRKDNFYDETTIQWLDIFAQKMTACSFADRNIKAMQILIDDRFLLVINGKTMAQSYRLPEGNWQMIANQGNYHHTDGYLHLDYLDFCILTRIYKL